MLKVEIHEPVTLTPEQVENAALGIVPCEFISLEEAKTFKKEMENARIRRSLGKEEMNKTLQLEIGD